MSSRHRFHRNVPASTLHDQLSAFLQRFALTGLRHSLKQVSHLLDSFHQVVEFGELLSRQALPPFWCPRAAAKTEEELADFVEREPDLASSLHHRQTVQHGGIVSSLTPDSVRRREHADLFVVADRR